MIQGRLLARVRASAAALAVLLPVIAASGVTHPLTASASGSTRMIASSGTVVFTGTAQGTDGYQNPEFRAQKSDSGAAPFKGQITDRRGSADGGGGGGNESDGAAGPNTHLRTSFNGLNHRQQRLANGGNQFSLEPPDQGLCVGKGSVMEIINDVTRVYDKAGSPRSGVEDLNTFYGYPAAVHRAPPPRVFGPFITDPSCLFDVATQRWFAVVLTIDVNPPDGKFTGPNHLDIAVSTTSDPTGAWTIYRVPAQDDGTQGTPDHGCSASADKNGNPVGHGPCFGDFPHIGANAHGFYVTTNEYSFFGPEFHAAQIYAFSKDALVSGAASVAVTQFDTISLDAGKPGFTIWPATAPTGEQENGSGSAQLFMSSNAADEVNVPDFTHPGPGTSTELLVWALTNTESLNEDSPALGLTHTVLDVNRYAVPPSSDQKAGDVPLADCLNDVSATGCGAFLLGAPDAFAPEAEAALDSSDTRMLTVAQAGGRLWGALDTALTLDGVNKAGIEWFIVKASLQDGELSAHLDRQGYLGLDGNNVTYPAIGVTREGRGVMAFSVMGADFFPSAGYTGIDRSGVGEVKIAAEGLGPSDGFSGYKGFGNPPGTMRPRWGDYGAAVPDGNSVWIASEYIGQTCDLAAYTSAPFGSCGGTRSTLANWYTRISQVDVH